MALKQYFYIVLVPLKFIPKRTASFWQTIKIPNRFVLKICTGGFADYTSLLLKDVCYRIFAELEFIPIRNRAKEDMLKVPSKSSDENPGKYNAMFERRAKKGQCFNQPYLGCREFSADFTYIENPVKGNGIPEDRDFGYMLYDMDFTNEKDPKPMFFRAIMKQGVLIVPSINSEEVRR